MGATATINIKALFDTSEVASGAKEIQNLFKSIKVPANLQSDFQKAFSNLESAASKVQQKYQQGFNTKSDVIGFDKAFKEAENAAKQYQAVVQKIQDELGDSVDLSKIIKWDDSTLNKLKSIETQINALKASLKFDNSNTDLAKIETILGKITSKGEKTTQWVESFKQALSSGDLEQAGEALTQLEKIWSHFKGTESANAIFGDKNAGISSLREELEALAKSDTFNKLRELFEQKGTIQAEGWQKIANILGKAQTGAANFNGALGQTKGQISGVISAQQQWNSSVDQFKSRIQYFFGLNNIIQLIRRSLREAYNTVKELDAAMAKTAVVTDFTIADMWDQLPKYTKLANELGVTTKGAYETMTLFYQQGLDTNQTFAIGTETMKMARIAGIDYATATDYMTSALRGFNMELNELSAQKVNDVYSRLAAITASNTQEISTAMTKVASLAHNANMEFETTSAFLAQMIETTRESAETAGTALKTVVARFSEVKKLFTKDQLTGTDEEGEIIDVNRIGVALRTAGIDLNKYFLGEVGLDDIFVELASKWDSLTSVQQRYIATQAAGSRQQSRFIAMMSNYSRTQELIAEAYNSTGASEKQFEKTQASLETAINRLTNAWNQFTMNLANNDAIKSVVTGLTKVLELLNSITGVFGSGWRTVLTGGATIATLLGGGRIANAAFSASKIARANQGYTWGAAFKQQIGRNPFIHNQASGELSRTEDNELIYGQRFHLFGQGGYFNPYDTKYGKQKQDFLTRAFATPEEEKLYRLQRQRRVGGGLAAAGLLTSAGGSIIQQNAETIAQSLDKSSESVEKFGKGMSTLGNTASIAGSMLMMLPPGINIVAAAITGLVGVIATFRGETQTEILSRLSTDAEEAAAAAKNASEAYDNLLSKSAAHNELLDQISSLKEGTLEFRKAILDANIAAQELIESYNIGSENYYRTDQGLIMFRPGAMNQIQEQQLNYSEQLSRNASVAKLNRQAFEDSTYYKSLEELLVSSTQQNLDTLIEAVAWDADEFSLKGETFSRDQLKQLAKNAGYGGKFGQVDITSYLNDIKSGKITNWDVQAKQQAGQELYRSTLQDLSGSNLDGITQLAIESLVDKYDAEAYSKQRKSVETEVGKLTDNQLKATYKDLFGQLPSDLNIDEIKDAVIETKLATQLLKDVEEERGKIDDKAAKETKNFNKTALQTIITNAQQNPEGTYEQLAANSALRTLAATQSKIAQYTDIPINLRFGDYTPEQIQQIGDLAQTFGTMFGEQSATQVVTAINNQIVKTKDSSIMNTLSKINFTGAAATDLRKIKDLGEDYANIFKAAFTDVGGEKGMFESFYYGSTEAIESLNKMADAAGNISADSVLEVADSCEELADLLEVGEVNAAGLAEALSLINTDQLTTDQLTSTLIKSISKAEQLNQTLAQTDKFLSEWKEAPSGDRFAKWASGGASSIMDAWKAGRYQDQQARQYLSTMLGTDFMRDYNKIMAEAGNIAEGTSKYKGKKGGEAASDYIEQQLGPQLKLFKALEESDNLKPLYDYFGKQDQQKFKDNGITFEDGMVHFATGIKTAEEASQALQNSGLSKTISDLMVSDFMQYSPDAILDWGAEAAQQGVNEFQKALDNGETVLRGELEKYNDLYGDLLPDDKWIQNLQDKYSGQVIDLDIDWISSSDPIDALEKGFAKQGGLEKYLKSKGALKNKFWSKNAEGGYDWNENTVADLDKMVAAYKALGASEAQALDLSQKYVDSIKAKNSEEIKFQASYEDWYQDEEGNWKTQIKQTEQYTTAVEAAAAAQQKATESRQEMENEILKTNISQGAEEGFKNAIKSLADESIEVKIEYQPQTYESVVPEEEPVTVTYDVGPYTSKVNHNEYVTVHYRDEDGNPISSPAAGGLVKSFASGSANRTISPGLALTGEEGPEFVWNKDKGYAYLTGVSHPELRDLKPGDRIFDANETKKILHGAAAGGKIPSLAASGYVPGIGNDDSSKKKSGGGGGGSGSKDKEDNEWKNEIDWLYNLVQNIEELERRQTKLQEEYDDLLKDSNANGKLLYKNVIKQMANLQAQLDHQTFALQKREQEMREFMDTTNDQDEYLWYNWKDRTIEIDWDKIDKITDEEQYNHIKELIDQAEDIQDKMDDAEDAIQDTKNAMEDLENIWRDTFREFEDRVLKAIVQSYQKVIDNYSELNTTLNDSNTAILDAINKEISLQRQIRDNTKTEEDIANNEARLAYLRRDTTGGNDLAALQLQKELEDQREQYSDNLVDQAVQRLQDDNDAAAQQREKQIEIMQAQLDYQSENGEFNQYMRDLIDSAISGDGTLATDSDLYRLLAEQENRDAMTETQREIWEEELNGTFNQVVANLLEERAKTEGTYFTAVTAAFDSLSKTYDKYMIGSYSQGAIHNGSTSSSGGGGSSPGSRRVNDGGGGGGTTSYEVTIGGITATGKTADAAAKAAANAAIDADKGRGGSIAQYAEQILSGKVKPKAKKVKSTTITKNAKGGLNDYTGWAWLDGTPQEPEYVLNARQTEAFLKLADVLPAAMSNTGSSISNTFGNTNVNIAVNVDKIDSDYSVDQMVSRIKDQLFSDASYRNVNTLSFMR